MVAQPHAVMFPYPGQGHINPMMHLARKLLSVDFFITFVNTDFNHERMFRDGAPPDLQRLHNLRFEHLPDGLPPSHGRLNQNVPEFTAAILGLPEAFAKLLERIMAGSGPPVTCIIADAFCSWLQDVADKFGVPRVSLWTTPVHANLAYHFQATLISHGYIPLKDKDNASKIITCIPGVAPMPLSDYISFFLVDDSSDYLFQWHLNLCMRRPNEAIWNLGNNFIELEREAIAAFRKEVQNFVPIGPLLPDSMAKGEGSDEGSTTLSLWPEESSCEEWLEEQEKGSVLYISFGSIASMEAAEVEELVRGLEESGAPFLWSVRADQGGEALDGLRSRLEAVEGPRKGLVVAWAPQVAVLCHKAVGGFLTHCGWNSVMESICCGVPILAKPGGFAEQRMNAHYIAERWQIGFLLSPLSCPPIPLTKQVVRDQIRALLGSSPAATACRTRLAQLRHSALVSNSPISGSSHANFHLFVDDILRRARSIPPP